MKTVFKEIVKLEELIDYSDKIKISVSSKGVHWHIDHSLKLIIGVCNTLKKSNPQHYMWRFNFIRLIVFTKGSIPRGKGKAPKSSIAQGVIHRIMLKEQIQTAKELLREIETLPHKSHFKHPYFGVLNLLKSIKFLKIHTNHHLKIIKDIIKDV